jgi:hypothetical protein
MYLLNGWKEYVNPMKICVLCFPSLIINFKIINIVIIITVINIIVI